MVERTKVECPNGHVYVYKEEPPEYWPEGAPICPICCKTWVYTHPGWSYVKKLKIMAKLKSRMEETHVGNKKKMVLRILPDVPERLSEDNQTR